MPETLPLLLGFSTCLLWLAAGARLLVATEDSRSRPDFLLGLALVLGAVLLGLNTAPLGAVGAYPVEAAVLCAALFWSYGATAGDEATGLEPGDRIGPSVVLTALTVLLHLVTSNVGPQPALVLGLTFHPFEVPFIVLLGFGWWRARRLAPGYFQSFGNTRTRVLALAAAAACIAQSLPHASTPALRFLLLALAPAWFLFAEVRREARTSFRTVAVALVLTFGFHAVTGNRAQVDQQLLVERLIGQLAQASVQHHRLLQPVETAVRTKVAGEPQALHEKRCSTFAQQLQEIQITLATAGDRARAGYKQLEEAFVAGRRFARQVFEATALREAAWSDPLAVRDADERIRDGFEECRTAQERAVLALQVLQDSAAEWTAASAAIGNRFGTAFLVVLAAVGLLGAALLQRRDAPALVHGEVLPRLRQELRGPLDQVLGYAALCREPGIEHKSSQRFVDAIVHSAERLQTMLDELVADTDRSASRVEVMEEQTALDELLREVLASARSKAERKGILVICELGPDLPRTLLTDGLRLRSVLQALLTHAVQWTRRGCITLQVEREDRQLCLHVRDRSAGLTAEQQGRLFVPLEDEGVPQIGNSRTGAISLAVAARTAAALGGRLTAASTLGRGTTMTLRIPLRATAEQGLLPAGLL